MRCSSPFLFALITLIALTSSVSAHFTLNGPVRSREGAMWPNDNRKYFPIGGTTSPRPILNCLDIPKSPLPSDTATLRAGTTIDLKFEIGNNARHVGICTATLVDTRTRRELHRFNDEKDCVNRLEAMTISLPPSKTCDDCVIVVKVAATHISASNPEFFDSCMDVRVIGGNEPEPSGQASVLQNAIPGTNQHQQTQNSEPVLASVPEPESQSEAQLRPQPESEPMDASIPQAKLVNDLTKLPESMSAIQQPTVTGNGSGECTVNGKFQCRRDGKKFRQCANGIWVEQDVPPGTKCTFKDTALVFENE